MFNNFHGRLNNLHKSITFTYELGGNELPFLDVKIKLADKIRSIQKRNWYRCRFEL